jgi:hypothetical protein
MQVCTDLGLVAQMFEPGSDDSDQMFYRTFPALPDRYSFFFAKRSYLYLRPSCPRDTVGLQKQIAQT